ncbi:MAG: hypothetical protein EPO61_12025 [Nitrospirae bacterium]|nr:MAG: hypothetical protein EPO61_12025 [Nitrospirota bacterium]
MQPNQQEDQFLEEVIGLFALEGQEWLEQIRAAQAELEQHPPPDEVKKLCETIRRALASLGGSAATVELTVVEQIAHGLLALVESLQGDASPDVSPCWKALGEGLDALTQVLRDLAARGSAAAVGLEPIRRRIEEALVQPGPSGLAVPSAAPPLATATVLSSPAGGASGVMQALLALRKTPDLQSGTKDRVLDRLLTRLKSQLEGEVTDPDSATVLRVVEEMEGQERAFLNTLRQLLPQLIGGLSDMKSLAGGSLVSDEQVKQLIETVEGLKDAAASVGAVPVAQFCDGLKIFVGVLSRRRLVIPPQRVEKVEARLGDVQRWTERWFETGRLERAAIQQTVSR